MSAVQASPETLYTITEVASKKLIGYSEPKIRELIESGDLGYYNLAKNGKNRVLRIGQSHIDKFLKERNEG